jgi:hypothetical protein
MNSEGEFIQGEKGVSLIEGGATNINFGKSYSQVFGSYKDGYQYKGGKIADMIARIKLSNPDMINFGLWAGGGIPADTVKDRQVYFVNTQGNIAHLERSKITSITVLIIDGNAEITEGDFVSEDKPIMLLVTGKLTIVPQTKYLYGFYKAGEVDLQSAASGGDEGLFVAGNLSAENGLVCRRNTGISARPTVFIGLPPQYLLQLLPLVGDRKLRL